MSVKPIPDGYHTVTPYLRVAGVAALIDFLTQAFDAKQIERMARPDGTVMHAEVKIGDSVVMMGEPTGDMAPLPAMIYLYLADTDAAYKRAMEAGGTSLMEPTNQFYGDRNAGVKDPCGNLWWIATRVEDVPPEELTRRSEAFLKNQAGH